MRSALASQERSETDPQSTEPRSGYSIGSYDDYRPVIPFRNTSGELDLVSSSGGSLLSRVAEQEMTSTHFAGTDALTETGSTRRAQIE